MTKKRVKATVEIEFTVRENMDLTGAYVAVCADLFAADGVLLDGWKTGEMVKIEIETIPPKTETP